MTERAFIKSCIKVAGLLLVIWGLMGLATSAIEFAGSMAQKHTTEQRFSQSDNDNQVKTSIMLMQSYQRMATAALLNLPAHLVQLLVGLYLCRRYHRLLKWLLKDEPTL